MSASSAAESVAVAAFLAASRSFAFCSEMYVASGRGHVAVGGDGGWTSGSGNVTASDCTRTSPTAATTCAADAPGAFVKPPRMRQAANARSSFVVAARA